MKNLRLYYILILYTITTVLTFAQNIAFKAEANKKTIAVGDHLQIGFYIESDEMDFTIDKPMKYPDHPGFHVIGEEKTQQVQYINGKGLVQDGIIILFQAEREGKFRIGTAKITINGKTYATKPIDVDVVRANSVAAQSTAVNQTAFLQANISNANPYVNEQVNLTVKMFAKDLSLLNRKRNFKQGKLEGLSPKMVTSRPETIKQEMVSGKQYFSEEVAKYVLFPEKEGQITIDPFSLDILVSGIYGTEAYELRSNPVTINAKPIPEEGRPKSFTGAVGDFKLKTDINKNDVKANESANLKVEISGTGNFNKLIFPEIKTPNKIEAYTPKKHNNFKTYDDGMQGSITSEVVMVPEKEGSYTISPVEFSYFDPKKEKFITLKTDEVQLSVNGNFDDDDDDDDINESNTSENSFDEILDSKLILASSGFIIVGLLGFILLKRKKGKNEEGNNEYLKAETLEKYQPTKIIKEPSFIENEIISEDAKKLLLNKLNILQQNIYNPDSKTFYQLQEDLLCQIGMKLTKTDLANFSDYSVGEKLVLNGLERDLVEEWKLLLSKARQAKYSANHTTDDDLTVVYFNTEKLIKQFIN